MVYNKVPGYVKYLRFTGEYFWVDVMRATRSDVAKLAGVSNATVSYVFNKKRYVSDELVKKVHDAAKQLNYYPDMIASFMSLRQTYNIGVLVDDLTSTLQTSIIRAIQRKAIGKGYFVNLCGGEGNFETYINNFISRRVDGVYIALKTDEFSETYIKRLLDQNIKVAINLAREVEDERVSGIELDLGDGIRQIVEFLKKKNHSKIAFLSTYGEDYKDDKRLGAFKKYMREYLGSENPLIEIGGAPHSSKIHDGMRLMERLLERTRDFTAVVCTNDLMALGAMKVITNHGLSIPDDISVVGIDNIELAEISTPALTTLDHRTEELGEAIFDVLYTNITTGNPLRLYFKPFIVERETVKTL